MGIFFACNCSKNRQYLFETNFNRDIIIVKKTKKKDDSSFFSQITSYFGGKDNILESTSKGSRLSLVLKDYSLVNDEELSHEEYVSIDLITKYYIGKILGK